MRSLQPSLKENKRYLLIRGKNLKKNIESSLLSLVGVLGFSKACPTPIKGGKDWVIISVNREALNEVRASFALWADNIEVLRVSGPLKGLKKK